MLEHLCRLLNLDCTEAQLCGMRGRQRGGARGAAGAGKQTARVGGMDGVGGVGGASLSLLPLHTHTQKYLSSLSHDHTILTSTHISFIEVGERCSTAREVSACQVVDGRCGEQVKTIAPENAHFLTLLRPC